MKKPKLCLALSVSLALLQANLIPALADPNVPAGWETFSTGQTVKPRAKESTVAKRKVVAHSVTPVATKPASPGLTYYSAHSVASGSINGQELLFLYSRNKGTADQQMPAAALTIHPALPLEDADTSKTAEQTSASAASEPPALVAMNSAIPQPTVTDGGATAPSNSEEQTKPVDLAAKPVDSSANDKALLAQLSPDQIVAQGDQAGTTATPIPPVVSGAVDMEEFKPSNVLELKVGQSRTFRLRNKIVRTSVSDPASADAVVMSERELMLLGKAPGSATLVVWDDAGNSSAIDVKISRDYSALQSTLREIDPRIIVKPFSVGGSDRVILLGDVDHAESVIRAVSAADAFMDDRGMKIIAANSRLINERVGEQGGQSGGGGGGGGSSSLAQIAQVDKYSYFSNLSNNVSRAQVMVSDGGRVTSLIRVRKNPLIVLHCTFMEMNTSAVRELGVQLGLNFTSENFSFGVGGGPLFGAGNTVNLLTSSPGTTGIQGVGAPSLTNYNPFTQGGGLLAPIFQPFFNPAQVNVPAGEVSAGFNGQPALAGFVQQLPQKLANYGATMAPVNFVPGSLVSSIGQAFFAQAPGTLLGETNLLGAPGGASFNPGDLVNAFTGTSNFVRNLANRWSLNPSIQGIITHSRARILAEPTLVTISGERAAFLAGGEIPIVQSIATAGQSQQSVVFEPFGLRLNMIPVLLENGSLNIEVSPEERLLSQELALNILGGTTSPIPGFTVRKTQTIVELKPGQELYISGMVTANSGRQLNKTPLLGEVPVLGALYRSKAFTKNESELVVAIRPEIILPGTPGQMKLPEEISKVEGPRDTNLLQVEPTVLDERYMTSGRADRSQKIPGIQPPGAPIPDNE